jgi:hypothetical protein
VVANNGTLDHLGTFDGIFVNARYSPTMSAGTRLRQPYISP